jgi:hypothetical protein
MAPCLNRVGRDRVGAKSDNPPFRGHLTSPTRRRPTAQFNRRCRKGKPVITLNWPSDMSALGHKQTSKRLNPMSALPPKATSVATAPMSALCHKRTFIFIRAHWLKVKSPAAAAVRRDAENDWGRCRIAASGRPG